MSPRNALLIRGRVSRTLHIARDPDTPACEVLRESGFFPMGTLDFTDRDKAVRGLLATGAGPGELCTLCFAHGARMIYHDAYEQRNGTE